MDTTNKSKEASIRYTLTLEDGGLVSPTAGGDRLDYEHSAGQIFVALEDALSGMAKGDKETVHSLTR